MNLMKIMTASDVARNFASVLDQVARGETIVVTRGGHRLATIEATPATNGAALADLLESRRGTLDGGFADDIAVTRSLLTSEDPWNG
jgi:antitoxin (DNA-binding transcriptional repressor) of toxin-antitoxin stability system